jgi:hypothetical protein
MIPPFRKVDRDARRRVYTAACRSRSLIPRSPPDAPAKRERARTPAAVRQRKLRANRKAGKHCYTLWISDRAVCGLIQRLILSGRLTEAQAMRPRLVAQALAALLEEEGNACAR